MYLRLSGICFVSCPCVLVSMNILLELVKAVCCDVGSIWILWCYQFKCWTNWNLGPICPGDLYDSYDISIAVITVRCSAQ